MRYRCLVLTAAWMVLPALAQQPGLPSGSQGIINEQAIRNAVRNALQKSLNIQEVVPVGSRPALPFNCAEACDGLYVDRVCCTPAPASLRRRLRRHCPQSRNLVLRTTTWFFIPEQPPALIVPSRFSLHLLTKLEVTVQANLFAQSLHPGPANCHEVLVGLRDRFRYPSLNRVAGATDASRVFRAGFQPW